MEAEKGGVQPQVREGWEPPEAGRCKERFSPRVSEGAWADWRFLAFPL